MIKKEIYKKSDLLVIYRKGTINKKFKPLKDI